MTDNVNLIARELGVGAGQVRATAELLAGGATMPFIARYRKEATGSLDEVAIAAIRDRLAQLADLDKRRAAILDSLIERELLADDLADRIARATNLAELEDIYLPFRPKRRTRAIIAREKGLEPLATLLLAQSGARIDATAFGVADREEALAGARDIIAEQVSEDAEVRSELRRLFDQSAMVTSDVIKKKKDEAAKFRDYFEWSEPLRRAPGHRILAVLRGSNEGVLRVHMRPDEAKATAALERRFLRGRGFAADQVRLALHDSYKRLLLPALERETLKAAKARADEEAISIFATNLRELLMAAPLTNKPVLAIDPGIRTGCKVAALDASGALKENAVIYPMQRGDEAAATLRSLAKRYPIEAIAIGNGTAGRETEAFVKQLDLAAPAIMVDESGASIYSASEVARNELPDHDLTVRGAVSIGRRLQDPLAELVKIDAKSIGVGQYQHDVDQTALKAALDDTVVSCVNAVGVDVNTASPQL
ncbi:MAG: Tex-like N-terminal domain-containing protein, partial [Planctomycetota bacterium]